MKISFKDRLKQGPVLFDGGLGTEIYNRGIFINQCYEELNLTNSNLIKQIHQDYKNAGADVITTNTFGANYFKLKNHNLQDKLEKINKSAVKIAKEVAKDDIYVAGSIGPINIQIEPLGKMSREEAKEYYKMQIKALVDAGVDLLIFETFIYYEKLKIAVEAANELTDIPIIAQLTIDDDGSTLTGAPINVTVSELEDLGVLAFGINCTVGPQSMLSWLEEARKFTNSYISIAPNAGKPKNIDGRNIYLTSPEYMGEYAKHFVKFGANIIGGCCGTTPTHIARMRSMIDAIKPEVKRKKYKIQDDNFKKSPDILPLENKSKIGYKLANNKFITFVELLAPRGVIADAELEKSKEMYYYGIDAINIPDGPRASARMSAGALALQIQNKIGIDTVLHFVCRDRNVIGMQSDLMGYYALGLKNILAITGDPPKLGNYPDATAVFDVDAIGLVNVINRLNHGQDIAGNPIGNATAYTIGVGANPGAIDLENEIKRLEWKIDAGAEYIVTQPIFDLNVFNDFMEKIEHLKTPVIAGLWPLVSIRNAEFMNNEVPGVNVPKDILSRMRKYEGKKEEGIKQGIEIAVELLDSIFNKIQGIQISAPFGRVESVKSILNLSGIKL